MASFLPLSIRADGLDSFDQSCQSRQVIYSKLGLMLTDNLQNVRADNVCPLSGHRGQAPTLVVEVNPLTVPVTAILEIFQLFAASRMKRVGYPALMLLTCWARCSWSVGPTPV